MRKIFFALAALATMTAVSCVKDEQNPDALVPEKEPEVVYDYSKLVINELSGAGEDNEKYWELYNTGDQEIDLGGVYINKDEELAWTGAKGVKIPAKGFYAIVGAKGTTSDGFSSGFSAQKSVIVELYAPDGSKLDTFQRGEKGSEWGDQKLDKNSGSWSRIPDGTGAFMITPTATPGAANNGEGATVDPDLVGNGDIVVPEPKGKVVLNELNGNGEDNEKYWELYNQTDKEVSLKGYTIVKDQEYDEPAWTGDEEDKIPAKGYFTIVGAKGTTPDGFQGGFSAGKSVIVELFDAEGNKLDTFQRGALTDEYPGWGDMDPLPKNKECSFSRVPNGTGDFVYAAPTLGEANGEKVGDIEQTIE